MQKKPYKLSKHKKNKPHPDSEKTPLFETILRSNTKIDQIESILEQLTPFPEEQKPSIKENQIPISIFNNKLAPLEAIVLFLKETLNLKLHKIAVTLNRDDRTIWLTHHNATKKKAKISLSSDFYIPLSTLSNRKFSILELVVSHLKESYGISLKQISQLIGKSPKTIWTVYDRAKKKAKK
jgi:predicted DNA-binding protein (UPF0251 family)